MNSTIRTVLCIALAVAASPVRAQPAPPLGERGVAVADAAVARPVGTPCVAELYADVAFDDHGEATSHAAKPREWVYTPPAQCAGPWAKVVLEADFSVSAGRQYDRTVSLWLAGVNILFGTTQEPSAKVAPSWHVERDLTDYAPLFQEARRGQTILNNWVDASRDGVIRGSARLVFYPTTTALAARAADPAARPADLAMGLVGDDAGHPVDVHGVDETLTRTITLPRNVERLALDLVAQSQAVDEQWYMCIDDADTEPTREFSLGPPDDGQPLGQCPGGNFREVAVSIDDRPAGLAPVYPWTYTGGIDPHLWRPTPDIQALNFTPYRMDLTPFAGLLDDGKPHTLAVRVEGAHNFFSLAANLLAWRDPGREALSGRLTQDTLAGQATRQPQVRSHLDRKAGGFLHGEVDTLHDSHYVIAGELDTSHGKVVTRVEQRASFANRQRFDHSTKDLYVQRIAMQTRTVDDVQTTVHGKTERQTHSLDYPLQIDIRKQLRPNEDFTVDIELHQGYWSAHQRSDGGRARFQSRLDNHLVAHSNTDFKAGGTGTLDSRGQFGEAFFDFSDSTGDCYSRHVQTRDQAVVAVDSGRRCSHGVNRLDAHAQP